MSNEYPDRRSKPSKPGAKGDGFSVELPRPPAHLSRAVRKIFKRYAKELQRSGILRRVDAFALGQLAKDEDDIQRIQGEIAEEGEILKGPNGGAVWNPKIALLERARRRYEKGCAQFGFTPSARAKLHYPAGEAPAKADGEQMELLLQELAERRLCQGAAWNAPEQVVPFKQEAGGTQ